MMQGTAEPQIYIEIPYIETTVICTCYHEYITLRDLILPGYENNLPTAKNIITHYNFFEKNIKKGNLIRDGPNGSYQKI